MELVETWAAPPSSEDGAIPNHPRFPVLIYRGVDIGDVEALFEAHGWGGAWTDGVFDFHHFHSTSHEVLAVVAGSATLELGGPSGTAFSIGVGDVLVLPAGTGHRRVASQDGFTVVGAYPRGQEDYDVLREADADAAARDRIRSLPVPDDDPVGGDGVALWRTAGG